MTKRFALQLDQIAFGIRRVNAASARKFLATAQGLLGETAQAVEQTPELIDDLTALDDRLRELVELAATHSEDRAGAGKPEPGYLANARKRALAALDTLSARINQIVATS